MSDDAEKEIMKIVNNLQGFSRLAQVLVALKKDKLDQKNNLQSRIKISLQKKMKESIIENELVMELPKKKLVLIENLVAEQHFKILVNSLNQSERFLQEFSANQEVILKKMQEQI